MSRSTRQQAAGPTRPGSEDVWRAVAKASFAVLAYTTPSGAPRSCGVVYGTVGRRLYVATGPETWKARHIASSGQVAVTVPVRRGGLLSLILPIPPATISFHGAATVQPADSPDVCPVLEELSSLLPKERRASAVIIEVVPEGTFVTYGIGVSLTEMRDPSVARARVPVATGTRGGDQA